MIHIANDGPFKWRHVLDCDAVKLSRSHLASRVGLGRYPWAARPTGAGQRPTGDPYLRSGLGSATHAQQQPIEVVERLVVDEWLRLIAAPTPDMVRAWIVRTHDRNHLQSESGSARYPS